MSTARNLRLEVILRAVDQFTAPLRGVQNQSRAVSRQVSELKNKMKELNKTQANIDSFRKLSRDTAQSSQQMKAAQDRATALGRSLAATANPTRQMSAEFNRAKKEAAELAARHAQLVNQQQSLRASLNAAGISTRNLSQHQRELRQNAASTTAALQREQQQLERLGRQMRRQHAARAAYDRSMDTRNNLAGAGAGMAVAGAAAGAALLVPLSAYAKAEDSAMQLNVAMMRAGGMVSKQFADVNKLAEKLGNELPGTTSDFQDMMKVLIQKGLPATAVLNGAGEATAKLAILAKVSFIESADAISVFQDSMGVANKDMVAAADSMQRLYNVGMKIPDIQKGFKAMGPALAYVRKNGIDAVKAIGPLLAIADAAGMDAGSAGNAYNKIIRGTVNEKSVKDVNDFALKGTGIKLNFVDDKGDFAGVNNMVDQLMKIKKLSDQKRTSVISTLFGGDKEVAEALNTLTNAGNDGIEMMRQKLADQASLQERIQSQLGTLANLWDAATGTATNAVVKFGAAIAPEVKEVVKWINAFSEWISRWAEAHPKLSKGIMIILAASTILITGLGGLALAASALLGPFAMLRFALTTLNIQMSLWTVVTKVALFFCRLLTGALGFVSKAVMFLVRALLMNPIGLLITGIAIAALLIYKYWEPIKAFFSGLWDQVKTAFNAGISAISAFITHWSPLSLFSSAFASVFSWFGLELPATFTGYGQMIVDGLWQGIAGKWDWLKGKFYELAKMLPEPVQKALDIHSPSRVFAQLGQHTVAGLDKGLSDHQQTPLDTIKNMARNMAAAAGGLIIGGTSLGAMADVQLDQRPPISTQASNGQSTAPSIQITIHAAPGMNEQALAQLVAQEIAKAERQRQVRSRSRLGDSD